MDSTTKSPYVTYQSLLKERAKLTVQMNAQKSAQNTTQVLWFDKKRQDTHRQLEELGQQLEKDRLEVLQDIIMTELAFPQLKLPGFTAIDGQYIWRETGSYTDFEAGMPESEQGIYLAFSKDSHVYNWRSETTTTVNYSQEYIDWVKAKAKELIEGLKDRFPGDNINMKKVSLDFSGPAHVDAVNYEGIFIPQKIMDEAVGYIRESNWVDADELKEQKMVRTEYKYRYPSHREGGDHHEYIKGLKKRWGHQAGKEAAEQIFNWLNQLYEVVGQHNDQVEKIAKQSPDLQKRVIPDNGVITIIEKGKKTEIGFHLFETFYQEEPGLIELEIEPLEAEEFDRQFEQESTKILNEIKNEFDETKLELDLEQQEWEGQEIERRLSKRR